MSYGECDEEVEGELWRQYSDKIVCTEEPEELHSCMCSTYARLSRDVYSGTSGECGERGGEEPEELHQGDASWVPEQGMGRLPTLIITEKWERMYLEEDAETDQTIFLLKSGKNTTYPWKCVFELVQASGVKHAKTDLRIWLRWSINDRDGPQIFLCISALDAYTFFYWKVLPIGNGRPLSNKGFWSFLSVDDPLYLVFMTVCTKFRSQFTVQPLLRIDALWWSTDSHAHLDHPLPPPQPTTVL